MCKITAELKHANCIRSKTGTTRRSQPLPGSIAGTRLHELHELSVERHHWTTSRQARTSRLPSSVVRCCSNAELTQAQTHRTRASSLLAAWGLRHPCARHLPPRTPKPAPSGAYLRSWPSQSMLLVLRVVSQRAEAASWGFHKDRASEPPPLQRTRLAMLASRLLAPPSCSVCLVQTHRAPRACACRMHVASLRVL